MLRIMNVAPLLDGNHEAAVKDLLRLRDTCGVTDVAFVMSLSPREREPTLDNAERLRTRFLAMRQALAGSGLRVGILLQSLIGHGYPTEAPYQRIVNPAGEGNNCLCPADPAFRDFVRRAVAVAASTKPEFLLVDDDVRYFHGAYGCFCQRHIDSFNTLSGGTFTRESLVKILNATDVASRRTGDAWSGHLLAGLLDLARDVRGAIDAVDPAIPCGLCACADGGYEVSFAMPIAKILAGSQPPFIRINNAWYTWYGSNEALGLLGRLYWTSAQLAAFTGVPELLAESDTCPHSRYSTSARALQTQMVFSYLLGCTGSKLWITNLGTDAPETGEAYRRMLARNIGMFREIRRLQPAVAWDGPATPLPPAPVSPWNPVVFNKQRTDTWATTVFGRLGIPCRVAPAAGSRFVMLSGAEADFFSDAEIRSMLAGSLLLDGPAAEKLCRRGFAAQLGVETVSERGLRLKPLDAAVMSAPGRPHQPATEPTLRTALFENALGGRVATYASGLGLEQFILFSRREPLLAILAWLNRAPMPALVISDIDILAMHGAIAPEAGGGELLALFDLNMDPLEEVRLRLGGAPPTAISRLAGDGTWQPLAWRPGPGQDIIVETVLESVVPLILRLQR